MTVLAGDVENTGGTNDNFAAGQVGVTHAIAVASGNCTLIRWRQRASGYTSISFAIYGDAGGDPDGAPTGNPLNVSSNGTDNTAGEKTVAIASTPIVISTHYNFGWLPIGGFLDYTSTAAAGHYHQRIGPFASWPAPYGTSDGDASLGLPIQLEDAGGAVLAVTGFIPHRMPLGV